MGIKIKHTDPTLNSFATDDLIVNVQSGSLFFKSNTKLYKLQGDDQSVTDISDSLAITGLISSIGSNYVVELDGNHGSGPRINMGTSPTSGDNSDYFMTFGAFATINNLDTKNRDFHLYGTNTTTGFYFDESTGRFGIGTAVPYADLHILNYVADGTVNDMLRLEHTCSDVVTAPAGPSILFRIKDGNNSASNLARIKVLSTNTSGGTLDVFGNDGADEDDNNMVFTNSNAGTEYDRMTIRWDGNVGIGTISPKALLHLGVNGTADASTDPSLTRLALTPPAHTGGPWNFVTRDDAARANLDIDYGATNKVTIDSSGFVGIGTIAPTSTLTIDMSAADVNHGTTQSSNPNGIFLKGNGDPRHAHMGPQGPGIHIGSGTSDTNGFYPMIRGVGSKDLSGGVAGLLLAGIPDDDQTDHPGVIIRVDDPQYNNTSGDQTAENSPICEFHNYATEHFAIAANGDLTGTDTSIASNSDRRLKKNIEEYQYDLEKFKQFKTKIFDWINPKEHGNRSQQIGFIAQDLEKIDPRWVREKSVKKESPDCELLNEDRMSKRTPLGQQDSMYVSIIQQLITKVENIEKELKELKNVK